MRKHYLLFILGFIFMGASCDKNKTGNLEQTTDIDLIFKASYGNTPLILNKKYPYGNDLELFFTKFNFYISDVALLSSSCAGTQVELNEVEMIDFNNTNNDSLSALGGFVLEVKNIPVGEYTGIRFGIGVSPELNRDDPSIYSQSHPLGQSSQYWEAWKSYIFSKVEGRADTDDNDEFDLGFAYHTGADESYREVCLFGDVSLTDGQLGALELHLDIKKLFITDNGTFDIKDKPGTHNEAGLETSKMIMDNFSDAFALE